MMLRYKQIKKYISNEVWDFINKHVLPQYKKFKKQHGLDHIIDTILAGCQISVNEKYKNIEKVFIICAYHDLGRLIDNKLHNYHSAIIMYKDMVKYKKIFKNYSKKEILEMSVAIYEHSSKIEKEKSILGKILSDADKYSIFKDNGMGIVSRNWISNKKEDINKQIDQIYHIIKKYKKGEGKCKFNLPSGKKMHNKGMHTLLKLQNNKDEFGKFVHKNRKRLIVT